MLNKEQIQEALNESNAIFEQDFFSRYTDENSTDEWKEKIRGDIKSQLVMIHELNQVTDPFDNSKKWNLIVQIRDWRKCYFLTDEESLNAAVDDFVKERGMENIRLNSLMKKLLNGAAIHQGE